MRLTASAAIGTPERNEAPAPRSTKARISFDARKRAERVFGADAEGGTDIIESMPNYVSCHNIQHPGALRPQNAERLDEPGSEYRLPNGSAGDLVKRDAAQQRDERGANGGLSPVKVLYTRPYGIIRLFDETLLCGC